VGFIATFSMHPYLNFITFLSPAPLQSSHLRIFLLYMQILKTAPLSFSCTARALWVRKKGRKEHVSKKSPHKAAFSFSYVYGHLQHNSSYRQCMEGSRTNAAATSLTLGLNEITWQWRKYKISGFLSIHVKCYES